MQHFPLGKLIGGAAVAAVVMSASATLASEVQVGDLRIDSDEYTSDTYFDPGFGPTVTRAVGGAPVQVTSQFSGTSQNAGDASPDSATDLGLRTYSAVTKLIQLNRYNADLEGDDGVQRVGAVQWQIDLAPLESYLDDNALALAALRLALNTDAASNAEDKAYDVYLSYTNPAEGIAQTAISATDPGANYDTFWQPAQTAAVGDVVGGTHKVLAVRYTGDLNLSESLLTLYNQGVREFNVIVSSGDYFSGRRMDITEGSGLWIETQPIPEPASALLLGAGGLMMMRRSH